MSDHRQHSEDRHVDIAPRERLGGERAEHKHALLSGRLTWAASLGLLAAALALVLLWQPAELSSLAQKETLPTLVERFNHQIAQWRIDDAEKTMQRAQKLTSDEPAVAGMEFVLRLAKRLDEDDLLQTKLREGGLDYRRLVARQAVEETAGVMRAPESEGLGKKSVLEALGEDTEFEFVDVRLDDAASYFGDWHGIDVRLDRQALKGVGIGPDTPITRSAHGISLRSVLRLTLRDLDLAYTVKDNRLLITTREVAKQHRIELAWQEFVAQQRRPAGAIADFDSLVDMITKTVSPDVWEDVGGLGAIDKFAGNLSLVVSQTAGSTYDFNVNNQSVLVGGDTAPMPAAPVADPFMTSGALFGLAWNSNAAGPASVNEFLRQPRGDDPFGPAPGENPFGSAEEEYASIQENPFLPVSGQTALSTFSVDVDTASYSNVRRFLTSGALPPPDAVRIEELVNYFQYDCPQPKGDAPFSAGMELAGCPWNEKHQLLRVALKGKEFPPQDRPAANLVFLLDVSGSMDEYDKLPLLKQAMKVLVGELREGDRVTIVVYAGEAGLALDATPGDQPITIRDAIDALRAEGSTNGSAGIQLAYEKAIANFIKDGVNRVILATDGDLNVGVTDDDALVELIKDKAASGVFLSVLGFGTGNLKDSKLEKLADNGNGNYAYIDNLKEARKVLVDQMGASLVTIAKDVKLQLEFNPAEVRAYRLIGYENRMLAARDFDDDTKDAGEIGAGHTVTALYELAPAGSDEQIPGLNDAAEKPQRLKYQQVAAGKEKGASDDQNPGKPNAKGEENGGKQTPPRPKLTEAAKGGELLTLALRYKQPDGDQSTKLEFTLPAKASSFNRASKDFQFAAAVASFGMLLRHSKYCGAATYAAVEEIADGATGADPHGRRAEFLDLVRTAERLSHRMPKAGRP